MKKWIFFLFLLAGGAVLLSAQTSNTGTVGAQFLKMDDTGREAAMGGSIPSLTKNAAALFWNPAGVVSVSNYSALFSSSEWWSSVSIHSAAIAIPLGDAGVIGLSFKTLSMDKMEITTEEEENGTGRYYEAADQMVGLTWASWLNEDFSAGVTAKYVSQTLWKMESSGFALDFGTQYHLRSADLIIGASVRNFGTQMKFEGSNIKTIVQAGKTYPVAPNQAAFLRTEDYPMPLIFQIGFAWKIWQNELSNLQVFSSVYKSNDLDEQLAIGGELDLFSHFFVRSAYRFNDPDKPWSAGFGTEFNIETTRFHLDYAYMAHEYLGGVQVITITLGD